MAGPPIQLMLDQHAEDAAILWIQRDLAVEAPQFNRAFLWRLDERLEAHLDGLRVAGRAGWETALAQFEAAPEPGEVFTLTALAFGAGSARGIATVLEILANKQDAAHLRAAISAMGWLPADALRGHVQPLLSDTRDVARALGLGACSVHRVDPGPQVGHFLSGDGLAAERALILAGQLGRADLSEKIAAVSAVDPDSRFYRAWAMVLLGDRGTEFETLKSIAARPGPHREAALMAVICHDGSEPIRSWLGGLGPGAELICVRAAGYLGDASLIPWLMERMDDPVLGPVAGESFSMITGADLSFLNLDQSRPEPAFPNDDPTDDRVALSVDDELPMPARDAVSAWWAEQEFTGRGPHFLGQPVSETALRDGFEGGYQNQRRVAAYKLAAMAPDAPLANWQARQARRVDIKHKAFHAA
ncbi:MAG: TIGR02270 family protein [Pseudomonadota bacterium]